ncbi:hypothetical protein CWC12_12070 [Pseudoalteromonas ruthenica]|uniref:Uncharacterized protein n=2 Tax=Pseudoalteromonas ruthenica TaxID=151081 RepID=A0A0F4PHQ6_9GAMM|nr:hypothetical protein TW76_16250 [Pseudoalteromonas ruthenica]KJY98691.1 hypothetical protein TW72_13295 [Pseudoalteromonas ruthenica]TMO86983.1 hypothetical protein CWC12_12070 [Pseudoalteromonas ruthenica]TMO93755.1 hypothetical protein CWC13_05735 [Pseudoalteromonas ruthenica]TMO97493.1 hypothetical protein CWC07_13505 [Pseudoalteromonas ruthenica]
MDICSYLIFNILKGFLMSKQLFIVSLFVSFLFGCGSNEKSDETTPQPPSQKVTIDVDLISDLPDTAISSQAFSFEFDSAVSISPPTGSAFTILLNDNIVSESTSYSMGDSVRFTATAPSKPGVRLEESITLGNITFALSSSYQPKELSQQTQAYLNNLDQQLAFIKSEPHLLVDGYLVSDNDVNSHRFTTTFASHSNGVDVPEGWLVGASSLHEINFIFDGNNVYLTTGGFEQKKPIQTGEFLPDYPEFYVAQANSQGVEIRLAYLHSNAYFINSLIRAYVMSGKAEYLELARKNGLYLANRVLAGEGQYARRFLTESAPLPTGMDNGIIVETLYLLSKYTNDDVFQVKLEQLSNAFEHTTEGVWNHWTNSVIGLLYAERVTQPQDSFAKQVIADNSPSLLAQIENFSGLIPYVMKESSASYPNFKKTYHTYDMMLVAKLEWQTKQNLGFSSVFQSMLDEAVVNYGPYYANNVEALLYAKYAFDFDATNWLQTNEAFLDREANSLIGAVSLIRANSAYLALAQRDYY